MNESPISSCQPSSPQFITPSRKPTQHHCNADKKPRPTCRLDAAVLAPICRNIFEEEQPRRVCGAGIRAQQMR